MGIKAVVDPSLRLAPAGRKRLEDLGLTLESDPRESDPTGTEATGTDPIAHGQDPSDTAGPDLAAALALGLASDALFTITPRPDDLRRWRQDAPDRLAAATDAAASAVGRALVAVLLPAASEPRPGPVVVLSPAGAAAAYELYVAGGLAAVGAHALRAGRPAAAHSGARRTGETDVRTGERPRHAQQVVLGR